MKKLFKYLLVAALAGASAPLAFAQSVRDVSEALKTPDIIVPQSFETDTKKMLEDWYLQNYIILDYEVDGKPQEQVSDEVLMDRLSRIPSIIEMPLNGPVRNMINFYANRKRQLVENMLGLSIYYMPIFEEALERHGMPNELRFLPIIESALVPTAVSRAGAAGLWQFMPPTAKGEGLEINSLVDQRRDPYLASDAAVRYLKKLYNAYEDWSLVIAAYNCGPGNVNKAIRRAGGGKKDFWQIYPFLPKETRGYVPAFIAANYIMTYHKDHGISPALAKKPIVVDTVHVNRRVHFSQISDVMGIPMSELRALNPQFRKDIIPGDIRPYSLVLPSLQALAYIANEDSIVNHDAKKYARRGYVEPATTAKVGRDAKGEYYDEETIEYHTVKRGETLSSVAKKYGVTTAQIRKYNKVGKSLRRGAKLKIVSVVRRYKPVEKEVPEENSTTENKALENDELNDTTTVAPAMAIPTDSLATDSVPDISDVTNAFADTPDDSDEEAEAPAPKQEVKPAKAEQKPASAPQKVTETPKPKSVTHTVRRGDNLSKIAKRYGVTVAAIKRANNMAGDNIRQGQKLKIPQK